MELTNYNEIRRLLERHGFRFSRALGQNFLTSARIPERIAEEAGLSPDTGALEIGPGVGCLTEQLSRRAGRVLAVELDESLRPVLAETLAGLPNVELLFADALKLDFPALVRERFGPLRPVVCANLPYGITTPLLAKLLESACFERITVMLQREVARRICAPAGTAEYGAFSVFVNWYAVPEILFDVPPDCFMPRPKVTSSVLRLTPRSSPPVAVKDRALFFRVVRAAFNQRRKTLANALVNGLSLTREQAASALRLAGLPEMIRGERLGIPEFAALSDAILPCISENKTPLS